jgi:thiol:disulfide interchange protein DsbD
MNPFPFGIQSLIPALGLAVLSIGTGLQAGSLSRSQHTEAELVSEMAAIAPGQPFTVALRLKMDPHWHTYWKNPGDSGLATTIEWTLPRDFAAGPIQWPSPERLEVGGLVSYAYEGEAWLLVEITPPRSLRPGTQVNLKARVDWLECKEICMPGGADLTLTLPVATTPRRNPAREIDFSRARALLPQALFTAVRIEDEGRQIALVMEQASPRLVPNAFFFPAQEQLIDYAAPQRLVAGATPPRLVMAKAANAVDPAFVSGVLRIEGPAGVQYFEVPPLAPVPSAPEPRAGAPVRGFGTILLFGFLGGLILNLMPCVFPVLGLKIMGLVGQAGQSRSRVIHHGLAYTGGVLASFWLLAGLLLALRAGGAELGWGFQLQEPGFVYALAALMLLFGLNMSGVFEVGASLVGTGARASSSGLGGSFLSGVLATVVATPCAAPFLAPALGAALALPALPSLVLFSAIALGLAAPFLALSAFPEAVRHLPRPGAWMETLKQGLAFLLYAAAAYLVWVLAGQADEARLLAALFSLVLLAVAAWIYGRCQSLAHPPRLRRAGWVTALLLAAAALAFGWPRAASPRELTWEPWSAERVEAALAANRPVYVDFTARWCATCQVNKRVVFGSSQVLKTFRERNVAALKADWTNQDPAITAELARFGRSAVPFNLVYLPGGAEPRVLPEVLTPGVVLDTLDGK